MKLIVKRGHCNRHQNTKILHICIYLYLFSFSLWYNDVTLPETGVSLFAYKSGILNAHCYCVKAFDRTFLEKSEQSSLNTDYCNIIAWARNFAIQSRGFVVTITRFKLNSRTLFKASTDLQVSIPILPFYNVVRWSPLPEHFVQVIHQILGPFVRSEVSAFFVLRIEHFVAYAIEPPEDKTLLC